MAANTLDIRPLSGAIGAEILGLDLAHDVSDETIAAMQGLDVLVLDCVRLKPHSTHLGLNEALEYIERIRPRRAFLTHLNHDVLYERDSKLLPPHVQFAYDGLVLESGS